MNRVLGDRTGRMRERLLSARLGNLDRQNERLRNEVSVLHSQLDHEREEHEELRDALRSKPKEVKVRKSLGAVDARSDARDGRGRGDAGRRGRLEAGRPGREEDGRRRAGLVAPDVAAAERRSVVRRLSRA